MKLAPKYRNVSWMSFIGASAAAVVLGVSLGLGQSGPSTHLAPAKPDPVDAPIPRPGMKLERGRFAIVITDPQVDFLSPSGVTWGVVGSSVTENRTVEHLGELFQVAKEGSVP